MFKKIITFIKYNTFTAIIIAVAFVAVASAVASNEDIKKNVIGEEIVETQGVDNTLLLATDLEEFDLEMKITDVFQDDENYYVDYQFNTLGIQDNVWQEIFNQGQLVVSIESLEGGDLGLYVMEELGEIIDYQLAYLKEVQENEEEKGETFVIETTEYTRLIGLVFDTKTKKLPGYELVVKPPVSEEIISNDDAPHPNPLPLGEGDNVFFNNDDDFVENSYYYEFLINNCLDNGGYWYDNTCNAEPEVVEEEDPEITDPVCDFDNSDLCGTQELCKGIGLYWYDEVCNIEEEVTEEDSEDPEDLDDPDDTPVCDADNLDLCDSQGLCEGIDLYWYNNICNDDAKIADPVCDSDNINLCDDQGLCGGVSLYWYNDVCNIEPEPTTLTSPLEGGDLEDLVPVAD